MPIRFVKISDNKKIFENNLVNINYALEIGRIKKNGKLLYSKLIIENGLMEIQNEKILFAPRTSNLEPLKLPKSLNDLKTLQSAYKKDLKLVEFFKLNERCNMSNYKWVLGSSDSLIKVDDFENRKEILMKI